MGELDVKCPENTEKMTPVWAYKTIGKPVRKSFLEGNTSKVSVQRRRRSQIHPGKEGVKETTRAKAMQ